MSTVQVEDHSYGYFSSYSSALSAFSVPSPVENPTSLRSFTEEELMLQETGMLLLL